MFVSSDRLSVDNCLKHPWLTTTNDAKLNNEKLNIFNEADRKKVKILLNIYIFIALALDENIILNVPQFPMQNIY